MRIWLIALLLLWASPVLAAPVYGPGNSDFTALPPRESCRINQARVNDPEPPLNLRTSPEILPDNAVQALPNGTWLSVLGEKDGWLQVKVMGRPELKAQEGWVAANRTDHDCNYFSETVETFPYTASGRIVGGGSHQYILSLTAGQVLILRPMTIGDEQALLWPTSVVWLESNKPVPNSPNSTTRWWTSPADKTSASPAEWRWTVTRSGKYAILYDSNFRGFSYGFSLITLQTATE